MSGRVIALVGMAAMLGGCGIVSSYDSSKSPVSDQPNGAVQCTILQGGKINTGKLPEGCVKIEGEDIGKDGVQLTVAGIEITFTSWQFKDGEEGESVGFSYTSSGPVCISIKASGETFQTSAAGSWLNPNGASGPEAHGISNVVICEPDESSGSDQPAESGGTSGGTTGSASGAGEDNASAPAGSDGDIEQGDDDGASGGAGGGSTGNGTGEDNAGASTGGSSGGDGTVNPDTGPTSPSYGDFVPEM
jgi:hypothetical protein